MTENSPPEPTDDDYTYNECGHSEFIHVADRRAIRAAFLGDERPDGIGCYCIKCKSACGGTFDGGALTADDLRDLQNELAEGDA